ncbi:MAG: anti-CBASS Acb1 family protein [Candidatus Paceibacterota bacterium]|jgi:hypothetical protein
MERTKGGNSKIVTNEQQLLSLAGALVSRANFANSLGKSYDGNRDIYRALGYPTNITYNDYALRYIRQDMAKAIIDRPANLVWQGGLIVQESKDKKDTELEKAWIQLRNKFKLQNVFSRADRLSGIGCYSVLLLGLDDVKNQEGFANPVTVGKRKLLYLKPYGEGNASIIEYENDTKSERFGFPKYYEIKSGGETGSTGSTVTAVTPQNIKVHYSRILHIVDDILENEIIGIPRLESVFNRLMDLEKLVGGSAEMFWRGARPGFQGKVDKDFQLTPEMDADLKNQIDEYENNLRRMLVNEGVTYESLAQQISDPSKHVDVQMQMLSAVTGIPKRVLTGSERGELSSDQDATEVKVYIQNRREEHAETHIVRPFVDRCIEIGILPKPTTEEYLIVWSDLFAQSAKQLVDIGRARSEALRNYLTAGPLAESVVPPTAFFEFFLGFKPNEIDLIMEMVGKDIDEEIKSEIKAAAEMAKATVVAKVATQPTGIKQGGKGKEAK